MPPLTPSLCGQALLPGRRPVVSHWPTGRFASRAATGWSHELVCTPPRAARARWVSRSGVSESHRGTSPHGSRLWRCVPLSRRTEEQTFAKIACWPCATWSDLGRQDIGAVSDLALGVDGRNLYAATDQGLWRLPLQDGRASGTGRLASPPPGLNPTCAINASGSPERSVARSDGG